MNNNHKSCWMYTPLQWKFNVKYFQIKTSFSCPCNFPRHFAPEFAFFFTFFFFYFIWAGLLSSSSLRGCHSDFPPERFCRQSGGVVLPAKQQKKVGVRRRDAFTLLHWRDIYTIGKAAGWMQSHRVEKRFSPSTHCDRAGVTLTQMLKLRILHEKAVGLLQSAGEI